MSVLITGGGGFLGRHLARSVDLGGGPLLLAPGVPAAAKGALSIERI